MTASRCPHDRISEKAFSQLVVDLARLLGWSVYRTWLSVRSPAGFPDLVLAKPGRPLETARGRVENPQRVVRALVAVSRYRLSPESRAAVEAELAAILAALRDGPEQPRCLAPARSLPIGNQP